MVACVMRPPPDSLELYDAYLPLVQATQPVAPLAEICPAPHCAHVSLVAPTTAEALPAGHCSQTQLTKQFVVPLTSSQVPYLNRFR